MVPNQRQASRIRAYVYQSIMLVLLPSYVLCQGPENVLLIVNESSEDSRSIGRYYATKRGLPSENVCTIQTPERQVISREVFNRDIQLPVVQHLKSEGLQDQILYLVSTKGVPLVVEGHDGPAGDLASVDSELAMTYTYLVYGSFVYHGRMENSYFAPHLKVGDFRPFLRSEQEIYLVTRLTGASLVDTILMIDRGLGAGGDEAAYHLDLPSQQRSVRAEWLEQAAVRLERSGVEVSVERSGKSATDLKSVGGYCSWGRDDPSFGDRLPNIDWVKGALATTFEKESFAVPGHDAEGEGDTASTALEYINQGLSGFGGFVADPTLDGYFRPQILFPAYVGGHNLAESFYLSLRYLSWRQVVVGDPLVSLYPEKKAVARAQMSDQFSFPTDSETGLPQNYSDRREAYLMHRYSTGMEPVSAFLKAEVMVGRGEWAEAHTLLQRSLGEDPYLRDAHLLMSRVLEQEGQFERSFEHYERAVKLGEPNRDSYLGLSRLAMGSLDDPQRAVPYLGWLYRRFGRRDTEISRLWAEVQFRSGNYDQAKTVYHRLVEEGDPAPSYALAALGHIYFGEENWEVAREFVGRALEESSNGTDLEPAAVEQAERVRLQGLLQELDSRIASEPTSPGGGDMAAPDPGNRLQTTDAHVLYRVPPRYPPGAARRGVEGRVVLSLLIDRMGQLIKSTMVEGDARLARAALDAVKEWSFSPRLVRGRPEPSRLNVAIDFRLKR